MKDCTLIKTSEYLELKKSREDIEERITKELSDSFRIKEEKYKKEIDELKNRPNQIDPMNINVNFQKIELHNSFGSSTRYYRDIEIRGVNIDLHYSISGQIRKILKSLYNIIEKDVKEDFAEKFKDREEAFVLKAKEQAKEEILTRFVKKNIFQKYKILKNL